ncbi:ABC transporter permease [Mangrovivirga sp. M17]|uniref:ABC transporter permease n=1 Tax=Mangrovivirga halotolerans TaxID=2993936 RepID=A0ABT3RMN3_9BACT|nr:ABC transporter permease [Mangrovivirga halotolerans]MCX2742618.1 ABC transporter permease [Mangrovivirga halotolerans]
MNSFLHMLRASMRVLLKQKTNTVINLLGLGIGVAGALILFIIHNHFSGYDKFHADHEKIFRVVTDDNHNGETFNLSGVPAILPAMTEDKFPQIEKDVFISGLYSNNMLITIPKKGGKEEYFQLSDKEGISYTENSFFEIFKRDIIRGNKRKILKNKNEAVISKRMAAKWFGSDDVIGKEFDLDGHGMFRIAGLMEDYTNNTGFPFDIFLSYSTIKDEKEAPGWESLYSDDNYFVKVKESDLRHEVDMALVQMVNELSENNPENFEGRNFRLQSLEETHTDTRYGNYNNRSISEGTLTSLLVIALLLLLTACVNFINLSTAVANKRSKEVGVRKVLGSSRSSLVARFLLETSILTLTSLILALIINLLILEPLNGFLDLRLDKSVILNFKFISFSIIVWIFLTVVAGFYPAILLSGFKPALTLKGRFNFKGSFSYNLRRILVGGQFFISQAFIICTIIMISQMAYFKTHDIGFDKSGIIVIDLPYHDNQKSTKFKNNAMEFSGVTNATLGMASPSSGLSSMTSARIEGFSEPYNLNVKPGDHHYIETYNMEIITGEGLVETDSINRFVVNETFVKKLGFSDPSEVVGKMMTVWGTEAPITGVVRDFHVTSFKREKQPVAIFVQPENYNHIGIKVAKGNIQNTVQHLRASFDEIYPRYDFDYQLLDEYLNETFYADEERLTKIFSIFSGLAIFIGCLGLYGLISYMAQQKMKEISVRKVLGASENQLLWVFSSEFLKLLVIASLVAIPASYFLMDSYLSEYAYKISISPLYFFAGLITTAFIAFVAISYRSYKAASTDPVIALKDE